MENTVNWKRSIGTGGPAVALCHSYIMDGKHIFFRLFFSGGQGKTKPATGKNRNKTVKSRGKSGAFLPFGPTPAIGNGTAATRYGVLETVRDTKKGKAEKKRKKAEKT